MAELEQIVHDLEEGELDLNQALNRYELGVRRLKDCHSLLQKAERKIERLTGIDAAGEPLTEPFDDTATHPESPAASPPAARAKPSRSRGSRKTDVDSEGGLF